MSTTIAQHADKKRKIDESSTKNFAFNTLAKVINSAYGPDSTDCWFRFINKSTNDVNVIKSHRKLLSALSPVFAILFNSNWDEELKPITIVDATFEDFETFMAYFYKGTIELGRHNFFQILQLAHKYDVGDLMVSCSAYAINMVDTANTVQLLFAAIRFDLKELKQKCISFLTKNTEQVFKSLAFLQCSKRTLKEILQTPTMTCKEHIVFDACIEWSKAKCQQKKIDDTRPENLRTELEECFELIRFKEMGRDELAKRYNSFKAMFKKDETDEILMYFVQQLNTDTANARYKPPITILSGIMASEICFGFPKKFVQVCGGCNTSNTEFMVSQSVLLAGLTISLPNCVGPNNPPMWEVIIRMQRMQELILIHSTKTPSGSYVTIRFPKLVEIKPWHRHNISISMIPTVNYPLAHQIKHQFNRSKWNAIEVIPLNANGVEARMGVLTCISQLRFLNQVVETKVDAMK